MILSTFVAAQKVEIGFLNRSVTVNGSEYRYVVYVKREFNQTKNWPVIPQLHGGGYGSDGFKPVDSGLEHAIRLHPERFTPTVVFRQAHAEGTSGWQLGGGQAALARGFEICFREPIFSEIEFYETMP